MSSYGDPEYNDTEHVRLRQRILELETALREAAEQIEAKARAIDDHNSVGTAGIWMKPAYEEAARIVRAALTDRSAVRRR